MKSVVRKRVIRARDLYWGTEKVGSPSSLRMENGRVFDAQGREVATVPFFKPGTNPMGPPRP